MKSNAERQRIWRLRQKGELPPAERCPQCGGRMYGTEGPLSGHGLCSRCWLKTPEGQEYERARQRERMRATRARKKADG
jgi:DNA-directed RNA polymerase subunit RPC12/RpoP